MCARQLSRRALLLTGFVPGTIATLAACATIPEGPNRGPRDGNALQATTVSSKSIVQSGELTTASARSLYDALRRLRPEFLWPRNATPMYPDGFYAGVIVDGTPMGDVLSLQTFPAAHVREVRYVTARDAMLRYGPGYEGGALLVTVGRR
ncbi:MAG TPA: hypothetical protein VJ803_00055 [Gemmatimonadaceae bacterium]|nr:hypothetical protein [Gemmatimonadaceae bacterium]